MVNEKEDTRTFPDFASAYSYAGTSSRLSAITYLDGSTSSFSHDANGNVTAEI